MRQAKDRGGQLGPWHWHKVVLDEGKLDGVLGQAVLQHVHVASLREPAQEVDRERFEQAELQRLEDLYLHLLDCVLRVGVVSDVDEVGARWREDFFDLGGEEHGGHTHQLQLGPRDRAPLHGKEPVDNGDGAEQSLL